MKKFAGILLALITSTLATFAQEGLKVVTPLFLATDVPEEEVSVITDYFISKYAFAVKGKAEVIDRDSFDMLVEEHNFQSNDWASKEGRSQLEMLNASHLVRGKLSKFRSQLVVTIKLIDVKTGVVYATYEDRIADVEELFIKMPEICEKLAEQIGGNNYNSTVPKKFKIGDVGPGGGIVFFIDGSKAYEFSETLADKSIFRDAPSICRSYKGGGYSDWYLPTRYELNLIYQFFLDTGRSAGGDFYWSSERAPDKGNAYYGWGQSFITGKQIDRFMGDNMYSYVRAIRSFSN